MAFPSPLITLEEHWLSRSVRDFYVANNTKHPNDEKGLTGVITPALMELGETRLKSMDESGISLQIISHAPNTLALNLATCLKVNNELSHFMKSRPGRFGGFATLPMADPQAASGELRGCVENLGFAGTLIDSNCEGRFYDNHFFWPVFEAAAELDVPVYIHPSPNAQTKPLLYDGNYPDAVAESLSEYGWGWHNETAVHFLRLFAAGLFDRYPTLKIVLGHLGEMLPFQLDRIERLTSRLWPHVGLKLERNLRLVWDENVWITTSGMFFLAPMATVLRQCKPDRIMFSVDYPFGKNEDGVAFLKALKAEAMVSDEVLEGIAYRNAERLLKVSVK
ncbi:hypothetical protein IMSHALPRED_009382 [Imshaugia aleurites]|uniref:Amidohydrolase-related domain-containing protein n=1 Tax=Imshaugia aleurites TaxID=172621 RepID=A0A8H3FYW1_9LECA|nr:hypothetical protein IMSHALPRED_009382 [Imshaugia aleurites]